MKKLVLSALALCLVATTAYAQGRSKDPLQAEKERNARTEAILTTKVISVDFHDASFSDVMKFLQVTTGVNIVVDPEIYASTAEEDLRITLKVDDLPAMNVLNLILKFKNLGRTFKYGVVMITTVEKSKGDVFMRIYDVNDLTRPLKDFPGPEIELKTSETNMSPAFVDEEEQEVKHFSTEEIVQMIRDATGDGTWDENPKCKITIFKGTLIVVQSEKVHLEISKLLQQLRAAR